MNNKPVAWNGKPLQASTITFNNANSDWVMQITADRKIIVNEDIEVSDAAKSVLYAVQNLLAQANPVKDIIEKNKPEIEKANAYIKSLEDEIEILRKAQEK